MNNEQIDAAVAELWKRRIDAFRNVDRWSHADERHPVLVAKEDATHPEDIYMLHEARRSLDERSRNILDVYVDVWCSFGNYRCSVCCRTTRQNEDIGYNCAVEC